MLNLRQNEAQRADLKADIARIKSEMHRLDADAGGEALSPGAAERWHNLERAIEKRNAELEAVESEMRAELIDRVVKGGGHPIDSSIADRHRRHDGHRVPGCDDGLRTIERAHNAGQLPDYAAERATNLVTAGSFGERTLAARWATAAGDDQYRGAFAKLLGDPTRGHLLWTPQEADAYRAVAAVQAEMESRAMSTTVGNGGYMIPLTMDPAIMLTNDGSNNPLRQLATVKQTMTNAWQGVTSAGATAEWKTEAAEAADGSPTVAAPSIPVFLGDSFVPYSFEIGQDAIGFLDELSGVLVDSADNLMATAYTTGTGSGQPQGIVTGLAGTASEINGGGSEAIIAADAYSLQDALPARFSANATWQTHIATANTFRQFETTNGALAFPELRETPPTLIGKRWYENSNMDGAIDAGATANNYLAVYGDVRRGFFIVDRVGSTLELIPNLVGANQRPTGERGAILYLRTGSKVVVPQALRLLDIATTA